METKDGMKGCFMDKHVIPCVDDNAFFQRDPEARRHSTQENVRRFADGQLENRSKIDTMAEPAPGELNITAPNHPEEKNVHEHDTLKYSLLGPSLTKSGQDNVNQTKVSLPGRKSAVSDMYRFRR